MGGGGDDPHDRDRRVWTGEGGVGEEPSGHKGLLGLLCPAPGGILGHAHFLWAGEASSLSRGVTILRRLPTTESHVGEGEPHFY